MKKQLLIITIMALVFSALYASDKKEQAPLEEKKSSSIMLVMKGYVKNAKTKEVVPGADISIREKTGNMVLAETKADSTGYYEIRIPRGANINAKAQAPALFYDEFDTRISLYDTSTEIVHDFYLPSELQLRLNFPTAEYDNPYPFVLDDDGNETEMRWQDAIASVAEDIKKYQNYIQRVVITGHTDDDGPEKNNIKLGENRARFLEGELQKAGVPLKLMNVKSSGEGELLDKREGESKKDWKKRCRRVVMTKEMKK